jgi:hypothetical protein
VKVRTFLSLSIDPETVSYLSELHSLSLYVALLSPGGRALTSTERAVEVLAAMVGQSYVKDELVHGSYRSVDDSRKYFLVLNHIHVVDLRFKIP